MKKLVAVLLSVLLVLAVLPVSAFAADSEQLEIYRYEIIRDENGLEHRRYVDSDGNEFEPERYVDFETAAALPSSYDARNDGLVTSVKNQGSQGTCWAHAFCAAAESSLISQGYETSDSVNLSEAHLAWFRFHSYVAGSSIPVQQDKAIMPDGADEFGYGGSNEEAFATVARWSGFTTEAKYPYNANNTASMNYQPADMFACDYNLTSAVFYEKSTDMNLIKQAILDNGAVSTSYYSENTYLKSSSKGYCYYQNSESLPNHGVAVVGWDDNFPASYFKTTAPGNGAWLVKNSWGSSWGSDGYFWMSYYELSNTNFCKVTARPAGDYDNNYQYDGNWIGSYGAYGTTGWMANIFTAQENEQIKGASFQVVDDSQYKCTLYLYTNLTSTTNPRNGTLKESKVVNVNRRGFYTVDFTDTYSIDSGKKFSIVVKLENQSGGSANLLFESDSDQFDYSSKSGQSFISGSGSSWSDCNSQGFGNVPVKAFTKNQEEAPAVESLVINTLPSKTLYYTGDTLDLTGLSVTANYSDGTSAQINANSLSISGFDTSTAGEKTVTLSYGGKSVSFKINVTLLEIVSLEVTYVPKTVYYVGDTFDTSGIIIMATYNDGSVRESKAYRTFYVPANYMSVPGEKVITIETEGLRTSFTITVLAVELTKIEVSTLPAKLTYTSRDTALDTTGLELKLTYNNGLTEYVRSGFTCSGFDVSSVGNKTITVSYGGLTTSFTINVSIIYADYSAVEANIAFANDLLTGPATFTDESVAALLDAIDAVVYDLSAEQQSVVDGYANAISAAANALVVVHVHSDGKRFLPVSDEQYESGVLTSGNYYMTGSVIENGFEIDGNVSICLAGGNYSFLNCPLIINNGSTLHIFNCGLPGKISFTGGSIFNDGTLIIDDGVIENFSMAAIYNYGTLTLNGLTDIYSESTDIMTSSPIILGSDFSAPVPISAGTFDSIGVNDSIVLAEYSGENDVSQYFTLINSDCELTLENGQLIIRHNVIILPATGKQTVIDNENKIIYGLCFGLTDISDYISVAEGYDYECSGYGTGSTLTITKGSEEVGSYRLVIFGDLTGDGWADGMDATIGECFAGGMLDFEKTGIAVYTAADCNHDGVIDAYDTSLLREAGVMYDIMVSQSGSPMLNSLYSSYVQLILQTPEAETSETVSSEEETDSESGFNLFTIIIDFIFKLISVLTNIK